MMKDDAPELYQREAMRCETCKWWAKDKSTDAGNEFHPCECHTMPFRSSMTVANGEPFNAGIVATEPKFGCIHWEPK